MDIFLKIAAVFLLLLLIVMQLLLVSPYAERFYADDLNGSPILSYQSAVKSGYVTLDVLGRYSPNSAVLMINGEEKKSIDRFPVRAGITEGDVIEIWTPAGTPPFYVYISERSGELSADLNESTVKIVPGINRILKAVVRER